MVKVAINNCIGGFTFPLKIALQMIEDGVVNYEYLEKRGTSYNMDDLDEETVKFEKSTRDKTKALFLVIRVYRHLSNSKVEDYKIEEVTLQTTEKMSWKEELTIVRSHPLIIEYLEKNPKEDWKCIKIVEIPEQYSYCWNVKEGDDGREWVAECHRTWS